MLQAQAVAVGLRLEWRGTGSREVRRAQHGANSLRCLQTSWVTPVTFLFPPRLCHRLLTSSKEAQHGDFSHQQKRRSSLVQEALLTIVIPWSSKRHDSWFCESNGPPFPTCCLAGANSETQREASQVGKFRNLGLLQFASQRCTIQLDSSENPATRELVLWVICKFS